MEEEKKKVWYIKISLSIRCFYKKKKKTKASGGTKTRKGGKITTQYHVVQYTAVSVCQRLGEYQQAWQQNSHILVCLLELFQNPPHTVFVY